MRFPRGARVRLRRQHQRSDGLVLDAGVRGVVAWGGFGWRRVEWRLSYRDTPRTTSHPVRVAELVDDRQLSLWGALDS